VLEDLTLGHLQGRQTESLITWYDLDLITGIIVGYCVIVKSAIDERGRSDLTIRGSRPFLRSIEHRHRLEIDLSIF
jgi:hypothetical protein